MTAHVCQALEMVTKQADLVNADPGKIAKLEDPVLVTGNTLKMKECGLFNHISNWQLR